MRNHYQPWFHAAPRPPFTKPRIRCVQANWFRWTYWTVEQYGCIRFYVGSFKSACRYALHLRQQDYMRRLLDAEIPQIEIKLEVS